MKTNRPVNEKPTTIETQRATKKKYQVFTDKIIKERLANEGPCSDGPILVFFLLISFCSTAFADFSFHRRTLILIVIICSLSCAIFGRLASVWSLTLFTKFYLVVLFFLRGVTQFYLIIPSFIHFYLDLPSFTQFLPSFTQFLASCTKLYPVLPSFTQFYLVFV